MDILRYGAFTDRSDGGNPAGVVLDARGLDDAAMLRVAADVGYSETAFATADGLPAGTHRLRYFSPRAEVDFCGHATVATAVALAERSVPGRLTFLTNAGQVDIETAADAGAVSATFTTVPASSTPAAPDDVDAALRALRWSATDLDPGFPPHVAYAGAHHLVLAAATRERLADLAYDVDALGALCHARGWTTVHLFHRASDSLFHARDPFPVGGVVEDPATGAAGAAFGAYLRGLGKVAAGAPFTVRQGEDMGRPSVLTVTPLADGRVSVTGRAVPLD
ncbi:MULTISPECIES: PhzF family phenazine biosynthesis protein [unclassified Streptomyces]|uniref:PhzF family phenazine biosynthesis protein n=1 Tax=unclassified Streptomyces TaxID=2593676 RepID=UPI00382D8D43